MDMTVEAGIKKKSLACACALLWCVNNIQSDLSPWWQYRVYYGLERMMTDDAVENEYLTEMSLSASL